MDLLNSPDISDVEALNVPHCALESMCEIKQCSFPNPVYILKNHAVWRMEYWEHDLFLL